MRFVAFLVVLLLPAQAGADTPEIHYRFELVRTPTLAVRVHVQLPGAPSGETTLAVDEQWGGVRAGGEDIVDVTATDAAGAPLVVARPAPHQVVVTHAPGATIHVRYAFAANEHQLDSDPSEYRRPVLNPRLFRLVGHVGLLRPVHIDDEAPCTVHLGWDGFDAAGWRVVSSWGTGTGERTLAASLLDMAEALYLAGDIRLITRDIRGYPLTITVAGEGAWLFTAEAFADACASVVETERAFFDDFARDFYWISLVPVGPPDFSGRSIGGTGLNRCFSLSVALNTPLDPGDGTASDLVRLLAHEMFHEWNGLIIAREDPEELVYWFSEGFTDFYARRLRYRGGLIDAEQYAASVSETLELFATNPHRAEPNARIHADFWNDRDVQKLPYQRGDIVAMILDGAIRRKSNGARSLDDVMRRLVADARTGARVSTENLFATFAEFADAATLASLRAVVENGATPDYPGIFAPCFTLAPVAVDRFDLGFDLDRSTREHSVTGVRADGPAAQAGLRDGMALKGWSVRRGETGQPVKFTVVVDGVEREISYLPRGAAVTTHRATVTGTDCSSL